MSDADSLAGTQLGPYRLTRLIGSGEIGAVYEAEDTRTNRVVALKLLPAVLADAPGYAARMRHEAHTASRLRDPHVLPIRDVGEIDGKLYMDMPLIGGMNLRTILSRFGPLVPARAVSIIRQVASALDAAHEFGALHGDIKPENILITRDDFVYLGDFGIARAATVEGLTNMGRATFAYRAPELFTHGETTAGSDIYALGAVLYECLTGSPPYPDSNPAQVITAHLSAPIPKPSQQREGIPSALDDVIARALAKSPEVRYGHASDLAAAAEEALSGADDDGTITAAGAIRAEPTGSAPVDTAPAYGAAGAAPGFPGAFPDAVPPPPPAPAPRAPQPAPPLAGPIAPGAAPPPPPYGAGPPPAYGPSPQYAGPPPAPYPQPAAAAPYSTGAGVRLEATVFAPADVERGEQFIVQVFAHLPEHHGQVAAMARRFDSGAEWRTTGGLYETVVEGDRLAFELLLPGLVVDNPVRWLVWSGRPEAVQFGAMIPANFPYRAVMGTVVVSRNWVPIGHLNFKVDVCEPGSLPDQTARRWPRRLMHRYTRAFISYASRDRKEVLKRAQMLAAQNIEFFHDVLHLDPGERWERRLYQEIDRCDVFFLFWSKAAKKSEWVLNEVNYALMRKGSDELAPPAILPVIIEGPPPVAPPPQLAHLQFNDRITYFMQHGQQSRRLWRR
jgi:hypothetical protein